MADIVADVRSDRSFTVHFRGDWGQANLHTVCGWLGQEMVTRTGPHSRYAIWNGRGAMDGVRAVARGQVDIAVVTPSAAVRMAAAGLGPFANEPMPFLRALGQIPQRDRLVMAVHRDFGVTSFDEIRARKLPLVIAAAPDDGESYMGFAAHRILEAVGISRATLESWGGRFIYSDFPHHATEAVQGGSATAIFQEAIMATYWHAMTDSVPLAFIDIPSTVSAQFESDYFWPGAIVPAGYFRGLDRDLRALEFSDFIILCRSDLPDELAYLLTHCLCTTRQALERKYRHLPPERSPVTYPLDPVEMARTPIQLHDGARRYYKEFGAL